MLHSMTGFGKATGAFENKKIRVEIKSLNSRNLDLHLKIPSLYKEKELELRSLVASQLIRGKVELSVFLEEGAAAESRLELNTDALTNYYKQIAALAETLGDQKTAYLPQLLNLPDAYKTKQSELSNEEWEAVKKTLAEACKHLVAFRTQEGEALGVDFKNRIESINQNAKKISDRLPARKAAVHERIKNSIQALEQEISDPNRFEQELIYYLEKLDISEEEVRLENHLTYFLETLEKEEQCGRKLGFIGQEIGREINTMGSKANDAEIQKLVVLMKDDLEKIKEQVLNVL